MADFKTEWTLYLEVMAGSAAEFTFDEHRFASALAKSHASQGYNPLSYKLFAEQMGEVFDDDSATDRPPAPAPTADDYLSDALREFGRLSRFMRSRGSESFTDFKSIVDYAIRALEPATQSGRVVEALNAEIEHWKAECKRVCAERDELIAQHAKLRSFLRSRFFTHLRDGETDVDSAIRLLIEFKITDCSTAIQFINEHFHGGDFNAGEDAAKVIIRLLGYLLTLRTETRPSIDDIVQLRRCDPARGGGHTVMSRNVDHWRANGWIEHDGWSLTAAGRKLIEPGG